MPATAPRVLTQLVCRWPGRRRPGHRCAQLGWTRRHARAFRLRLGCSARDPAGVDVALLPPARDRRAGRRTAPRRRRAAAISVIRAMLPTTKPNHWKSASPKVVFWKPIALITGTRIAAKMVMISPLMNPPPTAPRRPPVALPKTPAVPPVKKWGIIPGRISVTASDGRDVVRRPQDGEADEAADHAGEEADQDRVRGIREGDRAVERRNGSRDDPLGDAREGGHDLAEDGPDAQQDDGDAAAEDQGLVEHDGQEAHQAARAAPAAAAQAVVTA